MNTTLARGVQRPPGQGTSKSAIRRRRRRQVVSESRAAVALQPRRRQRRRNRGPNITSFVHCVIDPFSHPGPVVGVPDRFSGVSLTVENRTLKVFADLKKYNYFLILPSFGLNLVYYSSDTELPAFKTSEAAKWTSVSPIIDDEAASKMASRFRTISLAAKMRYVGPAAVRNGWIRATRFSWQTNGEIFTSTKNGATNRVVQFDTLDLTETAIMSSPSSVSLPVEQGIYTSSVRLGGESWDFVDVHPESYCISTDDLVTKAESERTITDFNLSSFDEDWAGMIVFFGTTSTKTGQSYFGTPAVEFEIRHCVEAVPALTSETKMMRTLARPSPRHDQAALNAVSDIQRDMVTGIPAASSWLERFAGGVGRVASSFIAGATLPASTALNTAFSALGLGGPNYPAVTF